MSQVIVTSKEELSEIIFKVINQAIDQKDFQLKFKQVPKDKIYGISEAAKFLGLAKPTIYAKTSKGEIPHFKKGKRLYFKEKELIAWLESGRQITIEEEQKKIEQYLKAKPKTNDKG